MNNEPVITLFAFACFALSPPAQAACREGCGLAFGNTFLGDEALVSNTVGSLNTAIGLDALSNNTTGGLNHSSRFASSNGITRATFPGWNQPLPYAYLFTSFPSKRELLKSKESIQVLRSANSPSPSCRARPVARLSKEGLR